MVNKYSDDFHYSVLLTEILYESLKQRSYSNCTPQDKFNRILINLQFPSKIFQQNFLAKFSSKLS